MGWIIENVVGAKTLADKNKLRIGTMDAFFLDRLCGVFVTDYNSASRTSLLNIHTLSGTKNYVTFWCSHPLFTAY